MLAFVFMLVILGLIYWGLSFFVNHPRCFDTHCGSRAFWHPRCTYRLSICSVQVIYYTDTIYRLSGFREPKPHSNVGFLLFYYSQIEPFFAY